MPEAPFGRLLTAMVTPFHPDGSLDLDGAVKLAGYLVDELGNDGLVISGTTGESPTTSDEEKRDLLVAVLEAVGDRAHVVTGVGSFDTRHTVELAETAAAHGAHGVLVVTPYYSRPPQAGLVRHFTAVADATDLPVMVYDHPGRAAVTIERATMVELAAHDRIVAVKDATGDPVRASSLIAETGLAYYSGDDAMTLPLLAVGGVGLVGTSTHFSGQLVAQLIAAFTAGDPVEALRLHRLALPIMTGVFLTQGVIMVKAGLQLQGRGAGPVRSPMVEATPEQVAALAGCLRASGLTTS